MFVGYAKRGYSFEALELFREIIVSGLEPNEFTIVGPCVMWEVRKMQEYWGSLFMHELSRRS